MKQSLLTSHGPLELPAFLPDATYGTVRAADSQDLEQCQIQAVVMNTFHLMQRPGVTTIRALGGLHEMSGWQRPILTDSGGFQAYSMIRQNAKYGTLTDKGILFRPEGSNRKINLTPEKTVQLQLSYGADIVVCLDDCTHVDDPFVEQQKSVQRTIAWAKRCKDEFDRLLAQRKGDGRQRPLLFGVIQGGGSLELRQECIEALLPLGFDGFGYGGWPLDGQNQLLTPIFDFIRQQIPAHYPLHALGVGHPKNIVECAKLGYAIFDSAMPTRDARHGRLYTFGIDPSQSAFGFQGDWFKFIYIKDDKHIKNRSPLSSTCDCLACRRYSLGYLHHLYKINESSYLRLATIHNLRFMMRLMDCVQRQNLYKA